MLNHYLTAMNRLLLIGLVLFAPACSLLNQPAPVPMTSSYMPAPVAELQWGMSPDQVRLTRELTPVEDPYNTFRLVYIEELSDPRIDYLVYYFDAELPGNPLYEVIVNYHDPSYRDADAARLLGPVNAPNNEWFFSGNLEIVAWTYMNKLIVGALIPGTELND